MTHYLTVCERGNVRSVTTAIILKDLYMQDDVIPVGVMTSSPGTLEILVSWADVILACGEIRGIERLHAVAQKCSEKVTHLDIGVDSYGQPMNPRLVALILGELGAKTDLAGSPTRWSVDDYQQLNQDAYLRRFA